MRDVVPVRAVFLIVLSAVTLWALASHAATPPFVKGIIVAQDGRPLHDVNVYGSNGTRSPFVREVVKTDKDGFFRLEQPVEVLHIREEEFRPLAVVVQPGGSELRIVLEEESRGKWIVPACSNARTGNRLIGHGDVRFSIPKGTKLKKHYAEDASSYSVYFSKHSLPVELGWAAISSPYAHDDYWILKSAHFGERWIKNLSNQPLGVDAEGEARDGKRWRRAALWDVTASYDGISAEAAKSYDALIDSACLLAGSASIK
jgi:hypothetical protein